MGNTVGVWAGWTFVLSPECVSMHSASSEGRRQMPPQPIPEKFRRTRRVPLMVNEPEFELLTSLAEALDLDVGPALRRAVVETAAALYGRNTAMLKRYAAAIDGANE